MNHTEPTPYYEDEWVTIYNGDALELMPEMKSRRFGAVVTDPPYMISALSAGNMNSKTGGWGDMMNASRWFRDWFVMCQRLLKRDGALWTFLNWRTVPVVMKASSDARWALSSLLVWDKDWIGPSVQTLRPQYEFVALLSMPDHGIADRAVSDLWTVPWSSHKPNGHPAEKPVALLRRILEVTGDVECVLDPFCGSGTTLRAAKDLGIRAVGIECEERWCEVAAKRCAQEVLPLNVDVNPTDTVGSEG